MDPRDKPEDDTAGRAENVSFAGMMARGDCDHTSPAPNAISRRLGSRSPSKERAQAARPPPSAFSGAYTNALACAHACARACVLYELSADDWSFRAGD